MRCLAPSLIVSTLAALAACKEPSPRQNPEKEQLQVALPTLDRAQASRLAKLALKCVTKEFPNKTQHVQSDAADLRGPAGYHPAFYGCYDWHSAVHGHWMLARLLNRFPTLDEAEEIRAAFRRNLTAENLLAERAYFELPLSRTYERTYGWAWLLTLARELDGSSDGELAQWGRALRPLTETIARKYLDFLPKQQYPIRSGVHPNTAFGLSLALDYARGAKDEALAAVLAETSLRYFAKDVACPAAWEPSGSDFLSPCLIEAELMSKVLAPEAFSEWLGRFLPGLEKGAWERLLTPVDVTDRTDPQLVHLDGLNLSRAWSLLQIAEQVGTPSEKARLQAAAARHLAATLPRIADGDYAGEHWLGSFAVYALTHKAGAPLAEAPSK